MKIFWFRCGYRLIGVAAKDEESVREYVREEFKNNRWFKSETVAVTELPETTAPYQVAEVGAPQARIAGSPGILQLIPYVSP